MPKQRSSTSAALCHVLFQRRASNRTSARQVYQFRPGSFVVGRSLYACGMREGLLYSLLANVEALKRVALSTFL